MEVLPLERNYVAIATNPEDRQPVVIKNSSGIVGHIPFNIAPVVSQQQGDDGGA